MRIHARIDWNGREVLLRDLTEAELPRIADYWFSVDMETLEANGVDHKRFVSPRALIERFATMIPTGDPNQPKRAFVFDVDGRVAGYTNLSHYSADENYSHWHIVEPELRQSGLSSLLYPYRLRACFADAPMERLIHMTRPANVGVNKLLDRFVPVAETRFVETPDGMSMPGVFNIRYVTRADLPRILALARGELPPD